MKRLSGENENLDTDLNIVPIIDAFVILICFLLFTAAFTQLVFLEAKLTSNTAAAAAKSRAELDQFRLVISFEDAGLRLTTTGSVVAKANVAIPKVEGEYDFATLHEHLIALKTEHPQRFSADIEFKNRQQEAVDYEKIVLAIDSIRHLSDEEYSDLRVAQKKVRQLQLTDNEKTRQVPEALERLAYSLMTNEVTQNTDQKLLFPDVALVGLD
jgi:biopolymer transport protein ExbD